MVSGTDHQHRYRHLRTEEEPRGQGEATATGGGGKVDIFYCEVCLVYRWVPDETAEQSSRPFAWMQKPNE
jgi:hypothetical protein